MTLTTVGYGDISPQTTSGQFFASMVMITGYGIIAVPTGIVTAEITRATWSADSDAKCGSCGLTDHGSNARFCRSCGDSLPIPPSPDSKGS